LAQKHLLLGIQPMNNEARVSNNDQE
jgi:hypothetical protein